MGFVATARERADFYSEKGAPEEKSCMASVYLFTAYILPPADFLYVVAVFCFTALHNNAWLPFVTT